MIWISKCILNIKLSLRFYNLKSFNNFEMGGCASKSGNVSDGKKKKSTDVKDIKFKLTKVHSVDDFFD
jgi:hypothetical protein